MKKSVLRTGAALLLSAMLLSSAGSVMAVETQTATEVTETVFDSNARKEDTIFLSIGRSLSVVYGKKARIDAENTQVVPYLSQERTFVPLRFIAEKLGAEVIWEEGAESCTIVKDDKEIVLTFGSADFTVNGEVITFDAAVEVVEERVMVPVRFISEQLGCDVYWNHNNRAVVISPLDNPWVEERSAEKIALGEALVTLLGFF